jgi:hypothetical protein
MSDIWRVCRTWKKELGHYQLPGICLQSLRDGAIKVADEWHNNGPQDLVMASLCIQIAINKRQLCLLSVAYACPYHIPTATTGHSVQNFDISKTACTHNAIHVEFCFEAS